MSAAAAAPTPITRLRAPLAWPALLLHPGSAGAIVAFLVTLPAWAPVLSPSFSLWRVDDGRLHLHRALFLAQLIKDGNLFPRWMPQQFGGYGYPTLNFYAPGLYYLILLLGAVSGQGLYFGMQAATAVACAAIVLGVYWLAWEVTQRAPAAFLAAVCVAYGPYVIQGNVFLSGSMTHVLGLAWMALLLATLVATWRRVATGVPVTRWWWLVAGCTAGVFLSHNAVAAVTAGVAALWVAILFVWRPSWRAARVTVTAGAAGTVAAAFFWLPALLDTSLVQIENNQHGNLNYHNHFLKWPGFHREDVWGLQSRGPWTPGFPVDLHLLYPNSLYGPVRLGLWQALIWLAGLLTLLWLLTRTRHLRLPEPVRLPALSTAYGVLVALVCYSQTFDWALPLWDRFAVLRSIQLPSRLIAPAMFGLALALAGAFTVWTRRHANAVGTWVGAAGITAVLVVSALGGRRIDLDPGVSHEMSLNTAITDDVAQPGYTDSMDEFLPRTSGLVTWHDGEARGFWLYERMFPAASWVGGRVRAWNGQVAVLDVRGHSLWTIADVQVGGAAGAEGGAVAFHQLALPGWRAWIDGRPVPARPAAPIEAQAIAPGFLVVDVPPGRHQVAVRFGPDAPRLAGAAISLLALGAAAAWLLRRASRAAATQRVALLATGAVLLVLVVVAAVRTVAPLFPPA